MINKVVLNLRLRIRHTFFDFHPFFSPPERHAFISSHSSNRPANYLIGVVSDGHAFLEEHLGPFSLWLLVFFLILDHCLIKNIVGFSLLQILQGMKVAAFHTEHLLTLRIGALPQQIIIDTWHVDNFNSTILTTHSAQFLINLRCIRPKWQKLMLLATRARSSEVIFEIFGLF